MAAALIGRRRCERSAIPSASTGPGPAPMSAKPVGDRLAGDAPRLGRGVAQRVAEREHAPRASSCGCSPTRARRRRDASHRESAAAPPRRRRAGRSPSACPPVTITASGSELADRRGELGRRRLIAQAGQAPRLRQVRGEHVGARQDRRRPAPRAASGCSSSDPLSETITGSTTTGTSPTRSSASATAVDRLPRSQHPDLDRIDADVLDDRARLGDDDLGGDRVDRLDAERVLRRERRDRAGSMHARPPRTPSGRPRSPPRLRSPIRRSSARESGHPIVRRSPADRRRPLAPCVRGARWRRCSGSLALEPAERLAAPPRRGCPRPATTASADLAPPSTAARAASRAGSSRRADAPRLGDPRAEQQVEHVLRVADDRGAVGEQPVRARRSATRSPARARRRPAPPISVAISAVISDPDRSAASTTTVIPPSAAISRLRAGNIQRKVGEPGGSSETTRPASRIRSIEPPAGSADRGARAPEPSTATVGPPPPGRPREPRSRRRAPAR